MKYFPLLSVCLLAATSAGAGEISREDLKKALDKNPDVLIEALRAKKRDLLIMVVQAQEEERAKARKDEEEAEKKELDQAFKNPLKPEIGPNTRIRGNKDAKYTLVEYSDFQCPYCARGFEVVEALRKKYGNDLRFIFKNKPLGMHPQAMPAARYLEAVAIQSLEKSWEFHDKLFANQGSLSESYYKEIAKAMGLNVKKLEADAASAAVQERVNADIAEADKFGFQGTPGYLLNGIPLRGAYPFERFVELIARIDKGQ